jgi:hypothetical protein
MSERWIPELRAGESVKIEPESFGAVVRIDGAVTVESRCSGRLTITVSGHGRIADHITSTSPTVKEARGLIGEALEVVRWTPEQGPEPGRCVWTGPRRKGDR